MEGGNLLLKQLNVSQRSVPSRFNGYNAPAIRMEKGLAFKPRPVMEQDTYKDALDIALANQDSFLLTGGRNLLAAKTEQLPNIYGTHHARSQSL